MKNMNQANQRYWDAMAPEWKTLRDQDQLWRQCPQHPELAFDGEALAMIREFLGDLHGKPVCVVGSGDNYDIHPFLRPWKDQLSPLEMEKPYTATGPFEHEGYGQTNYEFNWRMSDLINPLLNAGLILRRLAESPAKDVQF